MTHWSWRSWGWSEPSRDNQFESSWGNDRGGGHSGGHSGGHWWEAAAANDGAHDDRSGGQRWQASRAEGDSAEAGAASGCWDCAWHRGYDGDDLATLGSAVADPAVASHRGSSPPSGGTDGSWNFKPSLSKDGEKSGSSGSCQNDWDIISPGTSASGGSAAWWHKPAGPAAAARPLLGSDRQAGQSLVACHEEETEPTPKDIAIHRQIAEENRRVREAAASEAAGASSSGAGCAVPAQQEARSATQKEAPAAAVAAPQGTSPAAHQDAHSAAALADQRGLKQLPPPGLAGDVYDAKFFLDIKRFTDSWRQHNAALKFLREELEDPDKPTLSPSRALQGQGDVLVATIMPHVKRSGPDWQFDRQKMRPWDWKELIAQLRDEDIHTVVHGAKGRSRGLVGCEFAPRPNSYDHLRHKARKEAGAGNQMLPMWDFVVHREDGTGLRLHPLRTTTWIDTIEVEGPPRASSTTIARIWRKRWPRHVQEVQRLRGVGQSALRSSESASFSEKRKK